MWLIIREKYPAKDMCEMETKVQHSHCIVTEYENVDRSKKLWKFKFVTFVVNG